MFIEGVSFISEQFLEKDSPLRRFAPSVASSLVPFPFFGFMWAERTTEAAKGRISDDFFGPGSLSSIVNSDSLVRFVRTFHPLMLERGGHPPISYEFNKKDGGDWVGRYRFLDGTRSGYCRCVLRGVPEEFFHPSRVLDIVEHIENAATS